MAALDPRALRVYVLTSSRFAGRSHRDVAMAALEGGAGAVQLRAPELPEDELQLYEHAVPPWQCYLGLRRYWDKKVDTAPGS